MEEEKGGGGAGESARNSSALVPVGGRQRFAVELRPDETTIVSWKKLVKGASKINGGPTVTLQPPSNAHPALDARSAPGQPAETEGKDTARASRFSSVIEKIERLYKGKDSSDEEDPNDVPDDDDYDTKDSFIDDTELDEYFQVDNSAIKHGGFFVNRGKLERINEPTSMPNQPPKKRKRKDLAKGRGEGDDGQVPNKHLRVGKKAAGISSPLVAKNVIGPSHSVALPSINGDMKSQNLMKSSMICAKKRCVENKTLLDPTASRVLNGEASFSLKDETDIDKQKMEIAPSKFQENKLKDKGEVSDASVQRSHDKNVYAEGKSQSGKLTNNGNELDQSRQQREKDGIRERPDLNVSAGKYLMKTARAPLSKRKEGSNVRPKSTMLDKAMRELEKMVSESRPPTMEVQDADTSSQAVKRRLPHEVKQKLAKVARLAQASDGKISMELVNRLMSILGHWIQLRTLKRNLKAMVNTGMSAKKEKDDRFLHMKKEIAELIRLRVPHIKSKALEQHGGALDDFQEIGNDEKEAIKRKLSMDDALEDKICDLYDLYVDGLDGDTGSHVRKLYAELAELWPDGFMDNHGIKRAICRAKDRKRAKNRRRKDLERKNLVVPKTQHTVEVESSSVAQPAYAQEKVVANSNNHVTVPHATVRMPSTSGNEPHLDRPKQEKVKGTSAFPSETRTMDASKKKVKRKPESELGEAHFRPEKLSSAQGVERQFP